MMTAQALIGQRALSACSDWLVSVLCCQLLCRVKDSAQLLQKKLDQHHNHKDQQVFNMYQVEL